MMSNIQTDLTKLYYEKVNNLMEVVAKILEADHQKQEISLFIKDLSICFQEVKQVQKQKEEFHKKLREARGL